MAVTRRRTSKPIWRDGNQSNRIRSLIAKLRAIAPGTIANRDVIDEFYAVTGFLNNHYHTAYDQINSNGEARTVNTTNGNQPQSAVAYSVAFGTPVNTERSNISFKMRWLTWECWIDNAPPVGRFFARIYGAETHDVELKPSGSDKIRLERLAIKSGRSGQMHFEWIGEGKTIKSPVIAWTT